MELSKEKRGLIVKFLNCFEQGKPYFQHDKVDTLPDQVFPGSSKRVKGITISYGLTQNSHLFEFLTDYSKLEGKYSDDFKPYLSKIKVVSLANDVKFKDLLKKAAREDSKYTELLEDYFYRYYLNPALSWCDKNGFVTALSAAIVADSYLHSGSTPVFLRNRFPATPKDGEKVWITQYITVRRDWLKNHSDPVLRSIWKRPQFYLDLVNKGDWGLNSDVYYPNSVKVVA